MSYQFFYWLHVVSYIAWLLAFIGSLVYGFWVSRENDAVRRRRLMWAERLVTYFGGHLGALGILISGTVLVSVPGGPQWGWFNIALYPWLALKQILFIIILILVTISIKRSITFRRKMRQEKSNLSSGTSKQWRSAYKISIAVYILVVISTLLGWYKPGLGGFF